MLHIIILKGLERRMHPLSREEITVILNLLDEAISRRRPEERERLREILGKLEASLIIQEWLQRIEGKIDEIMVQARAVMLPEHLRPTVKALHELGEASASQIAERTGRTRAGESACLNELARLGYVEKRRVGRTVYFSIKKRPHP